MHGGPALDKPSASVHIAVSTGGQVGPRRCSGSRRDKGTMGIFSEIFSWWGGNTWSNRIYTALRGQLVGTDAEGNEYYVQSRGVGPLGVPRRWVIYKNLAEASKIPPEWHGWMHYTVETPPTKEKYQARPWQLAHRENKTGTSEAYRPPGSILASGTRPRATGDYTAWNPE